VRIPTVLSDSRGGGLKYRLRVTMAGSFRVGPATVQSMYAPEFAAYSAGAALTATPSRPIGD
jgi:uncharacterized protein YfaS (alpha-2-macroglobulin family)